MIQLPKNKIILYGGAVAVVAGLYVLYQRNKAKSAASPETQDTVSASQDLSGLAGTFQSLIGQLSDSNKASNNALAGLITTSDENFVAAINGQTAGITDSFKALQSSTGTAELAKAEAQQTLTITDALNVAMQKTDAAFQWFKANMDGELSNLDTDINRAIANTTSVLANQNQSLSDKLSTYLQSAFGTLNEGMKQNAETLAQQVGTLNGLTQSLEQTKPNQYISIGLQSAAACFVPDTGVFDPTCVNSGKLIDWNSGGGVASRDAQIKQKYAPCLRGNHYDLACVGQQLAGRFGA